MTTWMVATVMVLAFVVLTASRLYKAFMDDALADLWEFPDPDSDEEFDETTVSEETESPAGDTQQGEKQQ